MKPRSQVSGSRLTGLSDPLDLTRRAMPLFICTTCGTQFADAADPPPACRICGDERQYVGLGGQHWTLLELMADEHDNHFETVAPGITSIHTRPAFAIGQRALLVQHSEGNVLWDCVSFIDQETVDTVAALGGVSAIAISHPHFYSSMIEWSEAFGDVPIYLHNADAAWVSRPDRRITFWSGETRPVVDGLTLVRCGGHFDGSSVLHVAGAAEGRGALLSGDTVKVGFDLQSVSVMRSYPNLIPVGPRTLAHVDEVLAPLEYDDIHGAWPGHSIRGHAKAVVARSLARYREAIAD